MSRCIPTKDTSHAIDLKELVDRLQLRGIGLPVLVRFTDILKHRLADIHSAFQTAIAQNQYQGQYSCVYPIKVNQQRQVVEEVLNFGKAYRFGLEAGSKPELLAVVALADNGHPIICNGFKDAEYIETAMLAQKIGRNIIPVVEKYTELQLIIETAARIGVRPQIGMRVKLASRGSGRWQSSGGFRSKFGLTVTEIMRGLDELKRTACRTASSCSTSISAARSPTSASSRAPERGGPRLHRAGQARRRPEVHRRGRRAGRGLRRLADQLRVEHELHARGVRQRRRLSRPDVCDEAGVPHPDHRVRERPAVVAYHSVLVFNVLGVSGFGDEKVPTTRNPDWEQPLLDLIETYNHVNARNALEAFHDAQQALDMALSLFSADTSRSSSAAWPRTCSGPSPPSSSASRRRCPMCPRTCRTWTNSSPTPTSATFALPVDSGQLGHQAAVPRDADPPLNEKPGSPAVLGDITCDSDGSSIGSSTAAT
jgi:arginine decarboxylase